MFRKFLLICVLLILPLALLACGGQDEREPAQAEATAVPTSLPAATKAPTATAVPSPTPTSIPEIPLGDEYRSEDGGFAFRTIPEYEVEDFYGFVSMMGPNSDPNLGPAIALIGGLNNESTTVEQLFEDFQQEVVQGDNVQIELSDMAEITIAGLPGMVADLSGDVEGGAVNGRIVVAMVTPTQQFTMFGAAPNEEWDEFAVLFDAVLASVSFFDPVIEAELPTAEPPVIVEAPKPETAVTEIRQWAASAFASSEYGNPDWAAVQATGAPDTFVEECADLPSAWASYESDTVDWLELTYDTPVVPTAINIIQTHSPDQVVMVELVDTAGAYHEIYTGEPENLWEECPYTLSILVNVKYEVTGLKITIDQLISPWNEIDAVELVGTAVGGTAATATTTELAETAPDGKLEVAAIHGYEDKYGTLYVVGLLTNHSQRGMDAVEVEIEIRDAAGASLYKDVAWTALYRIAPGETTPFQLMVYDDLTGVDSFTATVVGQSTAELNRPPVSVQGVVRSIDDNGNVHLTGQVVNNGSQPIVINGVAAATFDEAGEIVTADSAIVTTGYLEPGASGPFRVFAYGPAEGLDSIADHAIYVDALPTSPEDPWALTFSEENRVYVDRYDDVHLVGEVTNTSDKNLDIRLLAAFYDADGNVLDADTFSIPLDLAPGDTLPFDMVGGWAPLEYTRGLFARVDSYTITWDQYWTWESSEVTVDLATANDAHEFNNNRASFTGQIVNDSGTAVDKAVIIVGLRDPATGQLMATDYDSIFDDIAAGGSADYNMSIDLKSGDDFDSMEIFFIVKGEQS